jgi:hypothetical protein
LAITAYGSLFSRGFLGRGVSGLYRPVCHFGFGFYHFRLLGFGGFGFGPGATHEGWRDRGLAIVIAVFTTPATFAATTLFVRAIVVSQSIYPHGDDFLFGLFRRCVGGCIGGCIRGFGHDFLGVNAVMILP